MRAEAELKEMSARRSWRWDCMMVEDVADSTKRFSTAGRLKLPVSVIRELEC